MSIDGCSPKDKIIMMIIIIPNVYLTLTPQKAFSCIVAFNFQFMNQIIVFVLEPHMIVFRV